MAVWQHAAAERWEYIAPPCAPNAVAKHAITLHQLNQCWMKMKKRLRNKFLFLQKVMMTMVTMCHLVHRCLLWMWLMCWTVKLETEQVYRWTYSEFLSHRYKTVLEICYPTSLYVSNFAIYTVIGTWCLLLAILPVYKNFQLKDTERKSIWTNWFIWYRLNSF